jgi:hypothetical protein
MRENARLYQRERVDARSIQQAREANSKTVYFHNRHTIAAGVLFDQRIDEDATISLKIHDKCWFMYRGFRYETDLLDLDIRQSEHWSFEEHALGEGALFYTPRGSLFFYTRDQ